MTGAFVLSRVAEDDDSEEEDENKSGEKAVQPRDSGCFESSDNLEGRREEAKAEEGLTEEQMKQEEEEQERREEDQQVDDVQQQLQQLTVDEES